MTQRDRLHGALNTLISFIASHGFAHARDVISQHGDIEYDDSTSDWAETLMSDICWAVERAGQAAAAAQTFTQPPRWIAISDAPGSRITWEWASSGPDGPGNAFCAAVDRSVGHVLGRSIGRSLHDDALRAALPVMRRAIWDYLPSVTIGGDIATIAPAEWAEIAPDLAAIRLATAIVGQQPDVDGVDTEWLDVAIASAPEGA